MLISPLGVDLLLATLLEGARGEDRDHLSHLLGLDQLDGFPYCDIKIAYQQSLKNIVSEQSMVNMFYYKSHVIQGTSLVSRSNAMLEKLHFQTFLLLFITILHIK